MTTSFWCSSCKVAHAGDCPPTPPNMDPPLGQLGCGFTPADPIDFDDLVDEYMQLDDEELKVHYIAAKEALMRKLANLPQARTIP